MLVIGPCLIVAGTNVRNGMGLERCEAAWPDTGGAPRERRPSRGLLDAPAARRWERSVFAKGIATRSKDATRGY